MLNQAFSLIIPLVA